MADALTLDERLNREAQDWHELYMLERTDNERLRAVALAAKALVNECADRGYCCEVPEHRLVELESALAAAGYDMTDDEFCRRVADEKLAEQAK